MTKLQFLACFAVAILGVTQATHLREPSAAEPPQRKLATTCHIMDNINFPGNTITSISNRPMSLCCEECAAVAACNAWSWFNNVCYLKSTKGFPAFNAGYFSADLIGDRATCSLQRGVDYVDNNIANTLASYPGACCDICRSWPGCKAFSWNNANGGTCWLKSGRGATVANANVISSLITPNPTYWCNPFQNNDEYIGNDISNVFETNVNKCCDYCAAKDGCKAWSWKGNFCYLKSAKGRVITNAGVISSTLVDD